MSDDDNGAYGVADQTDMHALDEAKAQLAAAEAKLSEAEAKVAELADKIAEHEAAHTVKDAKIAELSKPQVPRGGIHEGSDLVGGNVNWPARTRGEGRINPVDQY